MILSSAYHASSVINAANSAESVEAIANRNSPLKRTILLSMGTRPEIIKMAPIYLELKKRGADVLLLHTGQHNELADSAYEMFDIKPDHSIELNRQPLNHDYRKTAAGFDKTTNHAKANNDNSLINAASSANSRAAADLANLSSRLLAECSLILSIINPHIVMVHGDTSSALMMSLAAYYHRCKIVHIEAGLRSHNEYHPYPEEKNRVLIGKLAHLHFAPTARARDNLLAEGVSEDSIHVVGNTIVKAAQIGVELFDMQKSQLQNSADEKEKQNNNNNNNTTTDRVTKDSATKDLGFDLVEKITAARKDKDGKEPRIVLITTHRRENHETGIKSIAEAAISLLAAHPDMLIVWPLHPNPLVTETVYKTLANADKALMERLILSRPLPYPVLLWILKQSWITLTDSGGIQEEAISLQTPVLVLRKTTERQELIESGGGILVGTNKETIFSTVKSLSENNAQYLAMKNSPNPFGDAYVVHRICNILSGADYNG